MVTAGITRASSRSIITDIKAERERNGGVGRSGMEKGRRREEKRWNREEWGEGEEPGGRKGGMGRKSIDEMGRSREEKGRSGKKGRRQEGEREEWV